MLDFFGIDLNNVSAVLDALDSPPTPSSDEQPGRAAEEAEIVLRLGRPAEAIALYQTELAERLRAYPEQSVQTAVTYNGLGEAYLAAGMLPEAETMLLRALHVRDERDFGGLELGPAIDAAVTRNNVAMLREAQGRLEEARAERLKGARKGLITCGKPKCSTNELAYPNDLIACDGCYSVFYCSKRCRSRDWVDRHERYCLSQQRMEETTPEADKRMTWAEVNQHLEKAITDYLDGIMQVPPKPKVCF